MGKSDDRAAVVELYQRLLSCWNDTDAKGFGGLFTEAGTCIGFDGSQLDGREAIAAQLGGIFADHQPGSYVGAVREVRFLDGDVALLTAVAGVVLPGRHEVDPDKNSVQSLVAARDADGWAVELYHNTPARWDGRPDDAAALTAELNALL